MPKLWGEQKKGTTYLHFETTIGDVNPYFEFLYNLIYLHSKKELSHLQSVYEEFNISFQLLLAFLRFRTVITSCCRSPSTSANLRLISEYRSCISFNSISIHPFRSINNASSAINSSWLPSLWTIEVFCSFADKLSSML